MAQINRIYQDTYWMTDTLKVYLGTAQDASISYNGTDLVLNPDEVGSGKVKINDTWTLPNVDGAASEVIVAAGDGTTSWGAGVTYGLDNEVPYTNGTVSGFDYSSGFTFDGTTLVLPELSVTATAILPDVDNTISLGSATYEFKELFLDGYAYLDGFKMDDYAKGYWGSANDCSIMYNGSAMVLQPREVGSGQCQVWGTLQVGLTTQTYGAIHVENSDSAAIYLDTADVADNAWSGVWFQDKNVSKYYMISQQADDDFVFYNSLASREVLREDYDTNLLVLKETSGDVALRRDSEKMLFGAGLDASIYWNGTNLVIDPTEVSDGDVIVGGEVRADTTLYRRYYHLALAAFDPGASGATWVDPTITNLGGFQITTAAMMLFAPVDVHADWDGASDIDLELYFYINDASSEDDTVDIKVTFYYQQPGSTAIRTQTVEVATNVGDGGIKAQYTLFKVEIPMNWDEVDNVVLVGDQVTCAINLEIDTSEVDDIVLTGASFYYHTTHLGIEAGDV